MFSIMGAATIIYGANLEGYFKREFSPFGHEGPVAAPVRHIPFWSDLVERNA
jgi:putative transposon-encoded protein